MSSESVPAFDTDNSMPTADILSTPESTIDTSDFIHSNKTADLISLTDAYTSEYRTTDVMANDTMCNTTSGNVYISLIWDALFLN